MHFDPFSGILYLIVQVYNIYDQVDTPGFLIASNKE